MKLELRTQYDVPGTADPILTYEKHCLKDSGCALTAFEKLGNEASILEDKFQNGILDRKIALQPDPSALPAFIRSLVGADATACTQITRYDFATHTGTTETRMERAFVRERISIRGTFSLRPEGPANPRGIFFDSSQNIDATVFLIGGKIEKTVAGEFAARNPELRDFNQAWLEKSVAAEEASEEA